MRFLIIILLTASSIFAIEPFTQSFSTQSADLEIMTVPSGREFVLRSLYIYVVDNTWQIDKNGTAWLSGIHHYDATNFTSMSFDDGLAVLNAGDGLILKRSPSSYQTDITIVGYFRDAADKLKADLNYDGKVDFCDLAILADSWLAGTN